MTGASPALRSLGNLVVALLVLFAILHVADRVAYGLAVRAAMGQPETSLTATSMKGKHHAL